MRNTVLGLAFLALVGCYDNAGDAWVAHIGGGGPEVIYDVVATDDGRVCAAGTFWATVTFGEGDAAVTLSTPSTQDIYVACYDATGTLTSVTQFGTHRGEEVRAITALPGGDVVITGFFSRTFGTGQDYELTAQNSADIFLARINKSGEVVWAKQIGSDGADNGTALITTNDGHLLLAGSFSGNLLFPTGDRVSKLNSAGSTDAMVMKLTTDGDVLWARRLGGEGFDQARAVAEGADGRIVIAGIFEGKVQLESLEPPVSSAGFNDVFVASLTADGAPVWLRELGGERQETLDGLVVDDNGRIHVTGNFQGEVGVSGITLVSNGSTDIFAIGLAANGAVEHAVSIGSEHTDQVFDLAMGNDGRLHYVGTYQGQADFDPGPGNQKRMSAREGDANAFMLTLDRDAKFDGVWTAGGIGVEMGFAIAPLHNMAGLVTAGLFNKGFDAQISGLEPLQNNGKSDVFVLYTAPR